VCAAPDYEQAAKCRRLMNCGIFLIAQAFQGVHGLLTLHFDRAVYFPAELLANVQTALGIGASLFT
jgi:hypothetical protein